MIKLILRSGLFLFFIVSVSAQAYKPIPIPDWDHTDLHRSADVCNLKKARATIDALSASTKNKEINLIDREGYTPLAYAAQNGCMKLVKLLVESGAVVDMAQEYSRWTPLLRAAQNRHANVVRYLLAHGAEVNIRAAIGQTALTEAILGSFFIVYGPEGDRDKTLQALLESGADVNLPGKFGRTPLMAAVFSGDANLVRLLISKGAALSAKDEDGKTALDYAVGRDEREIADILKSSQATPH